MEHGEHHPFTVIDISSLLVYSGKIRVLTLREVDFSPLQAKQPFPFGKEHVE